MKHQDFWAGMVSLCIAAGALGVYQVHAFGWQEQKIQQESGASGVVSYANGTYTGSGDGFGGTITVEVTVTDHRLSAIDILEADDEDTAYLDKARQIIDDMIAAQSTEVDTISGATFSSSGIQMAVQTALEGAAE